MFEAEIVQDEVTVHIPAGAAIASGQETDPCQNQHGTLNAAHGPAKLLRGRESYAEWLARVDAEVEEGARRVCSTRPAAPAVTRPPSHVVLPPGSVDALIALSSAYRWRPMSPYRLPEKRSPRFRRRGLCATTGMMRTEPMAQPTQQRYSQATKEVARQAKRLGPSLSNFR